MTNTPHNPHRSKAARLLDALTHSGPGYDVTPTPPEQQPAAAPLTPEREHEWRQQITDAIGPEMHFRLQDAVLHDEPGAQRIEAWVEWIADEVLPIVRAAVAAETERLREEHATWRKLGKRNLDQAHAEQDSLKKRLHDAAMTKTWTNEDGKKFVFVEDLAPALLGSGPVERSARECTCEPSIPYYGGPSDPAEDCLVHGNPGVIAAQARSTGEAS